MNQPKKLYSKQYDSYCTWNGIAYENDGKVPGARFYGLEKAKNCGFEPIEEQIMSVIYMEQTLNLLAQKDLKSTENLVKQGEIKQTENESGAHETKYLKTVEEVIKKLND